MVGMGFGVSKVVSISTLHWLSLVALWLCRGMGKENIRSFFTGEAFLWMPTLWHTLHNEQITSPQCTSTLVRPPFPMLLSHRLFVCLLPKSSAMPLDWLKTPGFTPHWLQEFTIFGLSYFPVQLIGVLISLWALLCISLPFALLCDHSLLHNTVVMICFSPKPDLSISYLL